VLDVSYHVSQYRNIISELRDEIARLRAKMKEDRPRSGDASNDKGEKLKLLRDQIVSTFREQMRLRSVSEICQRNSLQKMCMLQSSSQDRITSFYLYVWYCNNILVVSEEILPCYLKSPYFPDCKIYQGFNRAK
jgi:hypothetical protein